VPLINDLHEAESKVSLENKSVTLVFPYVSSA
jgi:hypothetical protein